MKFTFFRSVSTLQLLLCLANRVLLAESLSTPAVSSSSSATTTQPVGNVLILDHLNINHEKGRHDWLKAFYFDFLQCAVDPRKEENLATGKKTLWANIGANQFHLPEGKPNAQVLDGVTTLAYPDLNIIRSRIQTTQAMLEGSKFEIKEDAEADAMEVCDAWGSRFRLVVGDEEERDGRGSQPGDISEGLAMRDLKLHVPKNANMAGIARFYQQILGTPILECTDTICVVSVGPKQTLTFEQSLNENIHHEDLHDDAVEAPAGMPTFLSNYGPHVSMYVADLAGTYARADALGLCYVNRRFKRRAYTLDAALDDCMFRCLDIVDPENISDGPILRLEHEIRSVVKRDGSKYKSCPFLEIPEACLDNS